MSEENKIQPYYIKDGIVKFSGKCDECLPYCAAHCCKAFLVNLTAEEVMNGGYDMEYETFSSNQTYYRFHLKKKQVPWSPYQICIYLNQDHKCDIYDKRPFACRQFTCTHKSVFLKQFRDFVDYSKTREKMQNGSLKLVKSVDSGVPPIETMGTLWTLIGDYKSFESQTENLLESIGDDVPYEQIRSELKYLINAMAQSVSGMEDAVYTAYRENQEGHMQEPKSLYEELMKKECEKKEEDDGEKKND